MRHRVRVAIADQEPPYRAGLRAALPPDEFEVVCEADTLASLEAAMVSTGADVVLVDDRLLDDGGIARLACLAAAVGVVTARLSPQSVMANYRQGALGSLPRDLHVDALPLIVADLVRGRTYAPPDLVAALVRRLYGLAPVRVASDGQQARLSHRQDETLALREQGLTTAEIARRLSLSPVTVRRHLSAAAHRGCRAAPAA